MAMVICCRCVAGGPPFSRSGYDLTPLTDAEVGSMVDKLTELQKTVLVQASVVGATAVRANVLVGLVSCGMFPIYIENDPDTRKMMIFPRLWLEVAKMALFS